MTALALVPAPGALTAEVVEQRVQRIRDALVFSLTELSALRAENAHVVAFGPGCAWHTACEAWFGDLGSLRLQGSPEAVAERNALVQSMRADEAIGTTRRIRERLGISSYAVQQALAEHDPAPDRIVGADGASRVARAGRQEPQEAPAGAVWEQAYEYLRRAGERGLTRQSLAKVAGWSDGKAGGVLVRLRRKGLAVEDGRRVADYAVHVAVEVES